VIHGSPRNPDNRRHGRGTYWTLSRSLSKHHQPPGWLADRGRIDWEGTQTRVLSILKQRAEAGESGLSNADLRKFTAYDRDQVGRMMREIRKQHTEIKLVAKFKAAHFSETRWSLVGRPASPDEMARREALARLLDAGVRLPVLGVSETSG